MLAMRHAYDLHLVLDALVRQHATPDVPEASFYIVVWVETFKDDEIIIHINKTTYEENHAMRIGDNCAIRKLHA